MDRRQFVACLLENRDDLLVVASIGSPTYDVAACGDHPRNFHIWSGLGSRPMVGLGLALARPQSRVAVVTGDGDVLMALAAFPPSVSSSRGTCPSSASTTATTAPAACSRARRWPASTSARPPRRAGSASKPSPT